jgi:hypothetical protein
MQVLAIGGILGVVVIAFAIARPWGSSAPQATTPPPVTAQQSLCLHLRDLLTPRVDAYRRVVESLEADAAAIAAEGDAALAADVEALAALVSDYADALEAQADTTDLNDQMVEALTLLPC